MAQTELSAPTDPICILLGRLNNTHDDFWRLIRMVCCKPLEAAFLVLNRNLHGDAILAGRLDGAFPAIDARDWTVDLTTSDQTRLHATYRQRASLCFIRDGCDNLEYR